MEAWKEELYHHGIQGQKWGVRRYQPYPSDYAGEGKYQGLSRRKQKSIAKGSELKKEGNTVKSEVTDGLIREGKKIVGSVLADVGLGIVAGATLASAPAVAVGALAVSKILPAANVVGFIANMGVTASRSSKIRSAEKYENTRDKK